MFHVEAIISQAEEGSWIGEYITWSSAIETGTSCSPFRRIPGVIWAGCNMVTIFLLMNRMNTEDEVLKKEFGEVWEKWAEGTKYQLIPGLI